MGSAWASSIATTLGFLLLLACFSRRVGHDIPKARIELRWREIGRMLRFGLPSGINYFLEFAAFALFINVVVGHLGTTTLAAFNIVFQLNMLSFMPAFGLASAGAILVGEAIGRGQKERVPALTGLTLRFSGGWMLGVGILYILLPGPFIRLFAPADVPAEKLIQVGTLMLGLSGVWQLFDAVAMTITESLRAAGDTAWPMAARIFLAWCVFTPGAWLAVLVFEGGPTAVMGSVIVYLFVLALVLAYRFREWSLATHCARRWRRRSSRRAGALNVARPAWGLGTVLPRQGTAARAQSLTVQLSGFATQASAASPHWFRFPKRTLSLGTLATKWLAGQVAMNRFKRCLGASNGLLAIVAGRERWLFRTGPARGEGGGPASCRVPAADLGGACETGRRVAAKSAAHAFDRAIERAIQIAAIGGDERQLHGTRSPRE